MPFGNSHAHVFEDVSSEDAGGVGWFVAISASNAGIHSSDFGCFGSVGCIRSVRALLDSRWSSDLRADGTESDD